MDHMYKYDISNEFYSFIILFIFILQIMYIYNLTESDIEKIIYQLKYIDYH